MNIKKTIFGILKVLSIGFIFCTPCLGREIPVAPRDYWDESSMFSVGLKSTSKYMLDGDCKENCQHSKQADWYFKKELVLIPKKSSKVSGYSKTQAINHTPNQLDTDSLSPIVWIGSSEVVIDTKIKFSKTNEVFTNSVFSYDPYWANTSKLQLVDKIDSNQFYFNATSAAFLKDKRVKLRGHEDSKSFIARTICAS